MTQRNGSLTDDYDVVHRVVFVRRVRATGRSRQAARYAWARIVKRQTVDRELRDIFNEVSGVLAAAGMGVSAAKGETT